MDGMTYNNGGNVLVGNSNFKLYLKTTWNDVNLHSWKLFDIPTITTYFIHPWMKGLPLYNIVIHFDFSLCFNLIFFSFLQFFFVLSYFFLGPTYVYKFKSCSFISIHGFFQVSASCLLNVRNFKFFILGLLLSCFLFLSCSSFFFFFHCTFFINLLSTLRSHGVKASKHE